MLVSSVGFADGMIAFLITDSGHSCLIRDRDSPQRLFGGLLLAFIKQIARHTGELCYHYRMVFTRG
jgi:hypothetical protein